jgi:hypothetical protein
MINEGRYTARAKSWDFGVTDNNNEQFAILFEITDGPEKGQSMTWYGMFLQGIDKNGEPYDMAKQTIETMRICGWSGDDLMNVDGIDTNEVQIVIRHETFEGKTRAKIKFVNKPGGLGIKNKLPESGRASLAKKFRGLALSVPKVEAQRPMREPGDDSYEEDFGGL